MKTANYYQRTPLSTKQKNIQAFQRLIDLSIARGYRGRRLDDRSVPDLTHCIAVWCDLQGIPHRKWGKHGVIFHIDPDDHLFEVLGTHKTALEPSRYDGNERLIHVPIHSLKDFFEWTDLNITYD